MSQIKKTNALTRYFVAIIILIFVFVLGWLYVHINSPQGNDKSFNIPKPPSTNNTSLSQKNYTNSNSQKPPSTNKISSPLIEEPPVQWFAQVQKVPSGKFKYGGSTTWAPIRKKVYPEIEKAKPNFYLKYTDPPNKENKHGSSTGIKMLLENQLDFSQSSRELRPDEEEQGLKQIPVAIDGIAFAVNPTLDIEGLTLEQLEKIYTGEYKNWKQVRGPDLPIKPYSRREEDAGTVNYFKEKVLKDKPLVGDFLSVPTTTRGIQKVNINQGGIYFASAAEVVLQCGVKPLAIIKQNGDKQFPFKGIVEPSDCSEDNHNMVNTEGFKSGRYPEELTRKLYIIIKQNDKKKREAGEAYANLLLTSQGQQLIEEAGFGRIK
jgi:phosphate transport system substrate-binding protein